MPIQSKHILTIMLCICGLVVKGQSILTLEEAVNKGVDNYGIVTAKNNYADAYEETIAQAKREYLPNLNLSAQQDYGTINGINGPLHGLGGLGVASSGLPLPEQNWNSAFGALYLANLNWEFFTFGRTKQKVDVARADANRYQKDYEQEIFQHKIRVSAAYLNLLASQRLLLSQRKNLDRAEVFQKNVSAKVRGGLLPGVDSTMAASEVSRARITLNQIKEKVKLQNNELSQLMGELPVNIMTDTILVNRIPQLTSFVGITTDSLSHPTRQFYQSRISLSEEQERLFRKEAMPTFNFFGVYQTRASGFNSDYSIDQTSYTQNYLDGINPTRQNYLLGVGVVWNLTTIARSRKKVSYQKHITQGLKEEYEAVNTELINREDAANARFEYAIENFNEAPLQVTSAEQAYKQRLALYNNGLSDLTDVITAQYALNRAETDRDIAFTNVWQALLMKAASTGDFNIFINEL